MSDFVDFEAIISVLTETTLEDKLKRRWWLFFAPVEQHHTPTYNHKRHVWPPFLGTRLPLGGDGT